jgi:hypothetical protein
MPSRHLAICTLLALLVAPRVDASDQGPSSPRERRFSVTFAAGSNINDGGDLQAVSFGYTLAPDWTLLVNVERNYIPTRVTRYPDGYAATRGQTMTAISGEVRQVVWQGQRIAPFWLAGTGVSHSRPNVNDIFPDRVTRIERVFYGGGGAFFPLHPALAVVVDWKFVFVMKENSEMGAMLPIGAGVTLRF